MNLEALALRPEITPNADGGAPTKISVRHLDFYYGSFQGLKDINLDGRARRVGAR